MKSRLGSDFAAIASAMTFALLIPQAIAVESPANEPLRANVENVEDSRGSSIAGCRVSLTFFGDDLDDVAGVLRARATKAIDELDRDILPPQPARGARLAPMNRFARVAGMRVPLRSIIALRNPTRRANSIKVIEGTVELFRPTEQNGGITKLNAPLATPGIPLKNPELEKNGITLTYITEEKAAELRRSNMATISSTEDEQRRLNAVAAEVNRRRAERESGLREIGSDPAPAQSPSGGNVAVGLPPSSATYQGSKAAAASPSREGRRFNFQVVDPNERLVGLEWRGADGASLGILGPVGFGQLRTFTSTVPPPPDAQLYAYIVTAGSTETRPFRVENVALP